MEYNETPMRPPYIIKDDNMLKLMKSIFIAMDQSWSDTVAMNVSKLIEQFNNEKEVLKKPQLQ